MTPAYRWAKIWAADKPHAMCAQCKSSADFIGPLHDGTCRELKGLAVLLVAEMEPLDYCLMSFR